MVIPEGLVNMFFLRHPRKFLSGICRYVRKQQQTTDFRTLRPAKHSGMTTKGKRSYEH